MNTVQVYVYGNVYYELLEAQWLEIKVFFDDSIVFEVPAQGDYHKILDGKVIESAKERIRQCLPQLVLTEKNFATDYSVHELDDELDDDDE